MYSAVLYDLNICIFYNTVVRSYSAASLFSTSHRERKILVSSPVSHSEKLEGFLSTETGRLPDTSSVGI